MCQDNTASTDTTSKPFTFHKISSVEPLPNYCLDVMFQNGEKRMYDVSLLFSRWPAFKSFEYITSLFETVRVDAGGYGIMWNDELDLSCDEIYEMGKTGE